MILIQFDSYDVVFYITTYTLNILKNYFNSSDSDDDGNGRESKSQLRRRREEKNSTISSNIAKSE